MQKIETSAEVEIHVRASFLPEESRPEESQYIFGYQIQLQNRGNQDVQLISRHWIITDGHGQVEEVRGMGVVGLQPRLKPGEIFEYNSACPLTTPTGNMRGTYLMVRDDGSQFLATVPQFYLIEPNSLN